MGQIDLYTVTSIPDLDDRVLGVEDPSGSVLTRLQALDRVGGRLLADRCDAILTLASGRPVFQPNEATPSSTDTGTDVVTFASAHGWPTGTAVLISTTLGGLIFGTVYYVRALSSTTAAFYSTFALATADSGRLNLTASITVPLIPIGLQSSTVYLEPYGAGGLIAIHDGTRTRVYAFEAAISLALSGMLGAHDLFVWDNGGTLALAKGPAWTSTTPGSASRGTGAGTSELQSVRGALHNKVAISGGPGALAGRYVGTIYASDATSVVDTMISGSLYNHVHPRWRPFWRQPPGATWTCTATLRHVNNTISQGRVSILCGWEEAVEVQAGIHISSWGTGPSIVGIGLNSATEYLRRGGGGEMYRDTAGGNYGHAGGGPRLDGVRLAMGQNELYWLEGSPTAVSILFYGAGPVGGAPYFLPGFVGSAYR